MMRRFLLLVACLAAPLRAQTLALTVGEATVTGARYVRWTLLERRGAENSVQVAELALIGPNGLVQPWAAGATITNPNGGAYPAGEEPVRLIDDNRGSKWLSTTFAASFTATSGRSEIIIDNGAPLPPILGLVWWTANDRPARDPVLWTLDLSADGKTWVRVDSVRQAPPLTRAEGVTRRFPAVPVLAASPVASLTCDGHPSGFAATATSGGVTRTRTERTTVIRGETCLGVVTLRSASTYMIHVRTATGWRSPTTSYSSRAAAESAVIAAGGK